MRIFLNKFSYRCGIQNVAGTQHKLALFVVFQIIQQAFKVNRRIRLPAVKQIQAEVKTELLFGFQVVVFWLTEKQPGNGAAAFVTVFVFGPEIFPAFVQQIVVNDFFRCLQPVLEFAFGFTLQAFLQLTFRYLFIRQTTVIFHTGGMNTAAHGEVAGVAVG